MLLKILQVCLLANFFFCGVDFASPAAVAVVRRAGLAVAPGLVFVVREPVAVARETLARVSTELKKR